MPPGCPIRVKPLFRSGCLGFIPREGFYRTWAQNCARPIFSKMMFAGSFRVHPAASKSGGRRGGGWALTADGATLSVEDWATGACASNLPVLESALKDAEAHLLGQGSVLVGEVTARHAAGGERQIATLRPSYERWPAWARHMIPVSKPAHPRLFSGVVQRCASLAQLSERLGMGEDARLAEWLFYEAKKRCGKSDLVADSVAKALFRFSRDETRYLPLVVRSFETYAELAGIVRDDEWLAQNLFRLARCADVTP